MLHKFLVGKSTISVSLDSRSCSLCVCVCVCVSVDLNKIPLWLASLFNFPRWNM